MPEPELLLGIGQGLLSELDQRRQNKFKLALESKQMEMRVKQFEQEQAIRQQYELSESLAKRELGKRKGSELTPTLSALGFPQEGLAGIQDQELYPEEQQALLTSGRPLQGIQARERMFSGRRRTNFPTINGVVTKVTTDQQGNVVSSSPLGLGTGFSGKKAEALKDFNAADNALSTVENLAEKVITATDFTQIPGQAASLTVGRLLRTNKEAVGLKSATNAFRALFARAAGHVGVLTDKDLALLEYSEPLDTDTVDTMKFKISLLRGLYNSKLQGALEAYNPFSAKEQQKDPFEAGLGKRK